MPKGQTGGSSRMRRGLATTESPSKRRGIVVQSRKELHNYLKSVYPTVTIETDKERTMTPKHRDEMLRRKRENYRSKE
jgi:hypothetical protein